MLERGCLGHPVHCRHCGAIFSSGFDLSQHLNVGGLTRSVPFSAYTTISLSSIVSSNSVFPTAVSFCPSTIFSVYSANPAPSILQFSLNSTSNPSSLNSGTDHSAISTCQNPDVLSLSSSSQSSSPSSLSSCPSPR